MVFVLYFVLCSLWQYSPYHTISSLTSLLKGGGRKQRKCAYCGVFVLVILSLTSNMWCSAWHIVIVHISYKLNILSIIWNAARNISPWLFILFIRESVLSKVLQFLIFNKKNYLYNIDSASKTELGLFEMFCQRMEIVWECKIFIITRKEFMFEIKVTVLM